MTTNWDTTTQVGIKLLSSPKCCRTRNHFCPELIKPQKYVAFFEVKGESKMYNRENLSSSWISTQKHLVGLVKLRSLSLWSNINLKDSFLMWLLLAAKWDCSYVRSNTPVNFHLVMIHLETRSADFSLSQEDSRAGWLAAVMRSPDGRIFASSVLSTNIRCPSMK